MRLCACESHSKIHTLWFPPLLSPLSLPSLPPSSSSPTSQWKECPEYIHSNRECFFDVNHTSIWIPYCLQLRGQNITYFSTDDCFTVENIGQWQTLFVRLYGLLQYAHWLDTEMCPCTLCSRVVVAGLVIEDVYRCSSKCIQRENRVNCILWDVGMTNDKMSLDQQMSPAHEYPSVMACHIHSVHGKCFMMIDDDRSLSQQSCGRHSALSSVMCLPLFTAQLELLFLSTGFYSGTFEYCLVSHRSHAVDGRSVHRQDCVFLKDKQLFSPQGFVYSYKQYKLPA